METARPKNGLDSFLEKYDKSNPEVEPASSLELQSSLFDADNASRFGSSSLFDNDEPEEPHKPVNVEVNSLDMGESDLFGGIQDDSNNAVPEKVPEIVPEALEMPVDGLRCTLGNGKKLVLKERKSKSTTADNFTGDRHYGVPIYRLLDKVKEKKLEAENGASTGPTIIKPSAQPKLLCEKWRPKKWTDLVGSEKVHRYMLKWLVAWNAVVFGSAPDESLSLPRDSLGRPVKKILLIHGAPGVGKTTLAHVMARQAGYDVMEINASDERSGPQVRAKLENSLQNERVTSTGKPVCIVADEVEGAAENGFIRTLISLIKEDERALSMQGHKHKKTNTKKKIPKLMRRPIVAICNDVYAPSLRELRQYAEVVNYTGVNTRTVVTRLREICREEGILLNTDVLESVAEATQGDLRASLNTIQFGLTATGTKNGGFALKDMSRSWSAVVNRIFRRAGNFSKSEDSLSVLQSIDSHGDYDKLMAGCFALYPKIDYHDDMVKKPGLLGEWSHFYESINRHIYRHQHGQLVEYLSQPVLAFHSMFSSARHIHDERVPTDYEITQKWKANLSMSQEFLASVHSHIRQSFGVQSCVMELAPYALHILSPSSSIEMLPPSQRRVRYATISKTMADLHLSLTYDKLSAGSSVLLVEPPIEQFAVIRPDEKQRFGVGKYVTRQGIREFMIQDRYLAKRAGEPLEKEAKKAKPQAAKPAKRQETDFFGRTIEVKTSSEPTASASQDHGTRIWVQYVEGFSNAVRKNITWADLF